MASESLIRNLSRYKHKYHLNMLFRGTLRSTALFIAIYLIINSLEHFFWFGSLGRTVLFFLLISILFYSFIVGILLPLLALLNIRGTISDEKAAKDIGKYFPEVSDKLINYLQLSKLDASESSLLSAAIDQKIGEMKLISFPKAIDFRINYKYGYILVGIFLLFVLGSFISPGIFTSSTNRIIHFTKEFNRPSPFRFVIDSELIAFKNDDYVLTAHLEGNTIPEAVYIIEEGRKHKLIQNGNLLTYKFSAVSREKEFYLEAAGYESQDYSLLLYNRPEIQGLTISVDYPNYTGLIDQQIANNGSLVVPEGSKLTWHITAVHTESVIFQIDSIEQDFGKLDNDQFEFQKSVKDDMSYNLRLRNDYGTNKTPIRYKLTVIKDEFPQIGFNFLADTTSMSKIYLSGNISDDYGFSGLELVYERSTQPGEKKVNLEVSKNSNAQQIFTEWSFKELQLQADENLDLYIRVYDNDGVNGRKSAVSQKFSFHMPDMEAIEAMISEKSDQSEKEIKSSAEKAKELNESLEELESRLKNKKELDWQDEKLIEELIKDKENLNKQLEELKEKHEELIQSQKEFDKQSDKLQKKAEQLQNLINEVLDEETKKLYDELQKLLKEEGNSEEVLEQLNKIQSKENNLEKELERAIELFKRLKMETKLEQTAEKLMELGKEQEKLGDETKDGKNNDSITEEKQDEIQKDFDSLQKELDEIDEMNKDLKNPEPLENLQKEEDVIDQELDQLEKDLEKNKTDDQSNKKESDQKRNQASQKMKKAGQNMQKMAKEMQDMQQSAEMSMMSENIDHLRDILDNLIKLSFDQEHIIDEISEVQQIDPRFIELSQKQLQLIANSKVIEDSLHSLASRVAQIESFISREISEINRNLDKSIYELRERNKEKALAHQQFAMTSMNNLALLLDDVLRQMQQSMSESMGRPQKGGEQKQSLPSMSEMQKQLSEQIQDLKKSGKSGRQLSEELAKLAAEQAELRRQLEQMQQDLNGQEMMEGDKEGDKGAGGNLKEALEMMEQNEVDLVNKRLTQQLINRQKEIMTRMLEAEKSMREREQSPEREGETAQPITKKVPPAIEQYLKAKEKEIELLKTIPLDLNPFYKKEVNDYFRRLSLPEQK